MSPALKTALDVSANSRLGLARRNPAARELVARGFCEERWYELSNGRKVIRVFATLAGRRALEEEV